VGKGQFAAPSCGCVFKNDYGVGIPSGMLLDAAGAKGLTRGGAEVGSQHANFIFNRKEATDRNILELTFDLQDRVYNLFGVWLQYEMELLGEFAPDLRHRYLLKRPSRPNLKNLKPLLEHFQKSHPPKSIDPNN
jgi:UDP-N-acetylmuramate dehydrogenase